MRTIEERNGYQLVRLSIPVYGGDYAVMKNGITIKDGLCLDAAIEVFNVLTKVYLPTNK
jgi:hypothetical protein